MKKNKSLLLIITGLIFISIATFFFVNEESSENPTEKQESTDQKEKQIEVKFASTNGEIIDISFYPKAILKETGWDYLNGHNVKEKNKIEYPLFIDNEGLFDSYYHKFYNSPNGEMTISSIISSYPNLDTAIKYFEEEKFDGEFYTKYNYSVSKNKEYIDEKRFVYILSNVIEKTGDFYQFLDIIIELDDSDYFQITYSIKNKVFDEKDIKYIINNLNIEKNAANYLLFEGKDSKGYFTFINNDNELKKLYLNLNKDKYKEIEDSKNNLDRTNFEFLTTNDKLFISIEYEYEEDILESLILEHKFDGYIKSEKDYNGKKINILTRNKEHIFYTQIDNKIYYMIKTNLSFDDIRDLFDYTIE